MARFCQSYQERMSKRETSRKGKNVEKFSNRGGWRRRHSFKFP